jgi:hypothetical protein
VDAVQEAGQRFIIIIDEWDAPVRENPEVQKEYLAEIQDVHDAEYAPTFYNEEQSLRYVIKIAYISCVDQYVKVEELPSGHGMADVVFLPRRRSTLPAMLIELKWNKTAEGAMQQILEKNYPKVLENYGGPIVLAGINYDEKTKKHTCVIVRHQKDSFATKRLRA